MVLADRLPMLVIADLVGVPAADVNLIEGWTTLIAAYRGDPDGAAVVAAAGAVREFWDWVGPFVAEQQRSEHGSRFVLTLIDAEEDERLTYEELAATIGLVLFGGHETTTNLIGTGLVELLHEPEQWRALCTDTTLANNAVEELLRLVTPAQWMRRVPVADVQFAGTSIAEGQLVIALLAEANRDATVFERPDELDIRRPNARDHLAFSYGPHFCLGASLARLEATRTLAVLARRFPLLELATAELDWKGHAIQRRLKELPVRLGRRVG